MFIAAVLGGSSAAQPGGFPGFERWLGTADGLGDARLYRLPPVVSAPVIAGGPLDQLGQQLWSNLTQATYSPQNAYVPDINWAPAFDPSVGADPGNPVGGPLFDPAVAAHATGLPGEAEAEGSPGVAAADSQAEAGARAAVPPAVRAAFEEGQLDELAEAAPEEEQPVKLWSGSFELGLDGTEGNSQTFNIRFGFDARRASPASILSLDLDYNKKTSDGRERANKLLCDWRLERLFNDAPWTCHVHGTVEYDEFQAYDLRWSVDVGVGYHFLRTKRTTLTARAGVGFAQEVGLPADEADDENAVEAVFGLEFSHQLNERQKLSASAEYTPELIDFTDCRLTTKAAWEVLLDEAWNLKLKLQARNRYDSVPRGKKHNDLDYAAMLMWSF